MTVAENDKLNQDIFEIARTCGAILHKRAIVIWSKMTADEIQRIGLSNAGVWQSSRAAKLILLVAAESLADELGWESMDLRTVRKASKRS